MLTHVKFDGSKRSITVANLNCITITTEFETGQAYDCIINCDVRPS